LTDEMEDFIVDRKKLIADQGGLIRRQKEEIDIRIEIQEDLEATLQQLEKRGKTQAISSEERNQLLKEVMRVKENSRIRVSELEGMIKEERENSKRLTRELEEYQMGQEPPQNSEEDDHAQEEDQRLRMDDPEYNTSSFPSSAYPASDVGYPARNFGH
jgi:hypothetical protein